MILLDSGKKICEDCYAPRKYMGVQFDVEGQCHICKRRHLRMDALALPDAIIVYTWPEGEGKSLGKGEAKRTPYRLAEDEEERHKYRRRAQDAEEAHWRAREALREILSAVEDYEKEWEHRHISKRPGMPEKVREAIENAKALA